MLTPIDIDNQQFGRQFKGYDVDEVDDFLEEISNDYEKLMISNQKQEEKIKELEAKLESAASNQNILQDTLLIAKQSADDMRRRAEEEANKIIGEAEALLADRAGNIDQIIEEKRQTLERLTNEIAIFKAKTEAMLVSQLELLKGIDS